MCIPLRSSLPVQAADVISRAAGPKKSGKTFLEMAERWEELARQRAAQMHLEDVLANLLKDRNG